MNGSQDYRICMGCVLYGSCDTSVGIRSIEVVGWTCFLDGACWLREGKLWALRVDDDVSRKQRILNEDTARR